MQELCSCGVRFCETTYHTLLCYSCGKEKFHGYTNHQNNQLYNSHYSPSCYPTYSRPARFSILLRRVFALDAGPKLSDPVWHYLENEIPYKSTLDIYTALKNSDLVTKHYGQLHLFSKIFTKYEEHDIDVHHYLDLFCTKFDKLLHEWVKLQENSFFSYNWIIERYLRQYQLKVFLPYIKCLQCPLRREKYELKMKIIDIAHEKTEQRYGTHHM